MRIYNTLSGKVEDFKPITEGKVGMYVCGPTVYDKGHLGHARSMIVFDMIRRYLEHKGHEVNFVTNYTDIDDKMINRAHEEGITVAELANKIIPFYERDFGALGIKPPTSRPKATEHVETMLDMIKKMLKEDKAYVIDEDGIYFDVSKFTEYGKLSKQKMDELDHGSRVAVNNSKRNPQDFALWKFKKDGEPSYIDETGIVAEGRPGWHIECSAMTLDLLGETFDIHGGGLDLTFPHHECEIAQSESCTGKGFANYWMHNGFVNIDGEKMSKSLNNFKTIEDALKVYNPKVIRYLLLATHYRSPIDFTEAMIEQAVSARGRIQEFYDRVSDLEREGKEEWIQLLESCSVAAFESAMDEDFNVSVALSIIFELVKGGNKLLDESSIPTLKAKNKVLDLLQKFNSIFQILDTDREEFSNEISDLIEQRAEARENRDYKKSDELRDELLALGVESKDSGSSSTYRRI